MQNVKSTYFLNLFFCLLFLPISFLHAQIDLDLNLNQSIQNPDAWTNYTIVATITNQGPEVAQNVKISIASPLGTTYQGGNEFNATLGDFNPYDESKGWIIPSLQPNSVATLTLNLFTLADGIAPAYSQVVAASPQDVDSTPNNGVPPNVSEDDEAYSGNVIQDIHPDLKLADVQIPASGNKGSVVAYSLDLVNAGNGTASGDYLINVYLSQNAGQPAQGTLVGEILTGNTAVGTIDNVSGAISIPSNFPAGNWYAVFYVDAENVITELIENNNKISIPFEVRDSNEPTGDFCGFEKEYFNMPEFLFNPRPGISQIGEELNDGYSFKVRSGNGQVGFNYVDLFLDSDGNQIAIDEDANPFPNTDNQLEDGGSYFTDVSGNNDLNVLIRDDNGNIVFDKNYNNLTANERTAFADPKVIQKSNGYYVIGSWIESSSPNNTYVYLAELDVDGNLLGFLEESFTGPAESIEVNGITVLSSGDLIMSIESLTDKEIFLARLNVQGVSWSELIVGDLVSNRVPSIQYSSTQDAVYVLLFFATEQFVRKVDAHNGATIWTTKLSDEFNPNSSSFRIFNLATSMVVSEDGGVSTGYVFRGPTDSEFQVEIGKLNSDGVPEWWRQFDWEEVNILEAMFETSDGGVVFAGRNENKYVVYKLNENGEVSPQCNNSGVGDIDLALDYEISNANPSIWSNFSTTLSITNTGALTATGVKVDVSLPDGVTFQGGSEYNSSQGNFSPYENGQWNVGSLIAGGTAILQINYFLKTNNELTFYAEVIAADEEDVDSSPNNGSLGVAGEDDEAVVVVNENGSQARISQGNYDLQNGFQLRKIYPNPASDGVLNFILSSNLASQSNIQVYNSQGTIVSEEQLKIAKGFHQYSISIDQLSSGLYFLKVKDASAKAASLKFFVERE